MNFFEQELRRLTKLCDGIIDPIFAGRACYGDIGGENRVKLEFVTQGVFEQYEALKATILNRTDGEVDTLLFRFDDIWGKKHSRGSGTPHIWTYEEKSNWYGRQPADTDLRRLAAEVDAYLSVFTDRALIPEKARKESVLETIRESKQTPHKPRKAAPTRKSAESEL